MNKYFLLCNLTRLDIAGGGGPGGYPVPKNRLNFGQKTKNRPNFGQKPKTLFSDKTANSCEFLAKTEITSYIVYDEIEVRKTGSLTKFSRCHRPGGWVLPISGIRGYAPYIGGF